MSGGVQTAASWRDIFKGPRVGIFIVLCFGVWLYAADSTVMATLIPSVVAEVGGEALRALADFDATVFVDGFEAGNTDLWAVVAP